MSILHTNLYPDDLFSSSRLTTAAAVEDSLAQFELVVQANFKRPDVLIAAFLQHHQHALPLVFSCIHEDIFNHLFRDYIYTLFRGETRAFVESFALQLLTKLSHFLYFHESPLSSLKVQECYRNIEAAVSVFKMLLTADFVDDRLVTEEDSTRIRARKHKQKPKRHEQTKSKAFVLDTKPFEVLGLQAPSTRTDADSISVVLLDILKDILNFYLSSFRLEDFASAIKLSFISCSVSEPLTHEKPTSELNSETTTLTEDVSVAYPRIQPMKSALHFDSIAGFGEWRIFISANADNELRSRRKKDRTSFDIIVKKIKELSNGFFSADNQKRLGGPSSEVPIFEAKMTADLRLIYQIDVVATDDERESQVIKIFGIYTHAQMDHRMWHSISRQLDRKGKEYRDRCAARIPGDTLGGKTFVPALFPPLPEDYENEPSTWLTEESEDDPVHTRFLMDKYVVFSQPLLNTMLADLDATFPHLVSVKERQIIEHPYSCFVIGRSGTGKTTTLLFKMLLVERTYQLSQGDTPKPRQIFVTQSRILAKKVEQYFTSLGRSLTASSASLEQLSAQRASQGDVVLDDEGDMIDVDDIVDWSGDLPSKFSELRDEHFPLFITFNGLCTMLEADIAAAEPNKTKKSPKYSTTLSTNSLERRPLSVTYEVFLRDYWPHFSQSLTNKLDPSLVFSELIGVIKGSEETLESTKHFLDAAAYSNLSSRNQSTFADNREDIYQLFTLYLAKKKRFGDIDGADRAHNILDFFKSNGIPGRKVDHLYVDEVQDNSLIDTLILRCLCHDGDGLFWAGDTAQTISVGSSFRFNSLKAFQWRLEEKRRSTSSVMVKKPVTFQLSVNYRSHSGIVDCAHSIIELIMRFWKDSIDRLSPEKGVVAGLKPLFFVNSDEGNESGSSLDQFVFGDSGNRIEFGAQQCILVRDEAAREEIKAKLGDVGLIMTIYESKGLEFNDVLLYNFFEDSPASLQQWRVILCALSDRSAVSAPDFERNKQNYTSICTELKFLYVAITRARENVWIIDSSTKGEPMRLYWTENDVARNIKPGLNAPTLATTSSPEEWANQGRTLFERKKWAEAKHCFERALQPDKVAIAEAYLRRERAERSSFDTKAGIKLRNHRFCEAAEAFLNCARSAARNRKLDFVRLAGSCYEKAGEFLLAAGNYHTARRFGEAVQCYRQADHYEEAINIVQNEDVDPSLVSDTVRVGKIFFFNQVQLLPPGPERNGKLELVGTLFESLEDQLEYLEDRDMDIARAALLVAHSRTREAAELHLVEGRVLEAIDLFIRDTGSKESEGRAAECILDGFWQKITFASEEQPTQDPDLPKLFELVKRIDQSSLTSNYRDEIAMFQAIMNNRQQTLRELGSTFLGTNVPAALLCLDRYFTSPLSFGNLTVSQMAEELNLFRLYSQHLWKMCIHPRPADWPELSKLFGFRKLSDSHVLLSTGSYLHATYTGTFRDQDSQISMTEFMTHFRARVSGRLRNRVFAQNAFCGGFGCNTFTPCLSFAAFSRCHREASCHDAHLSATLLTDSFYNIRLRIHMQQIQIVRILHNFYSYSDPTMVTQRRFWLTRLYESLFPPSHFLGTPAALRPEQIPEFSEARQTVQIWVRDFVYKLNYRPNFVLSDLTRLGTLAMVFDTPYVLSHALHRGVYAHLLTPPLLQRRGAGSIVAELIGLIEVSPNPDYLVAGLLTLRHVMTESVPIEISLLCDLLDNLCRSLILVACSRRDDHLHNVTLPRSWLLKPISIEEERRKQFHQLPILLDPIGDLLVQIYGDNRHLLYENHLAANIPFRIRTIFISRICRAICLLGYNIGNDLLRSNIHATTSSLRTMKSERYPFPAMYRSYVEACSWNDLARTVRNSTKGSAFDEMVNIQHTSRYDSTRHSPGGVRTVIYNKIEDIPKLLVGAISPIAPPNPHLPVRILKPPRTNTSPTSLAMPAPLTWKSMGPQIQAPSKVITEAAANTEVELEEQSEEQIEDVAQQAIPFSFSTNGPVVDQLHIHEPTENEHRQASVIQEAYKRYASRRMKQRTQLAISREKWFMSFLEMDSLQPGRYRKMLLGPLPHVLVWLDLLYNGAHESKAKTKKRTRLLLKSEELDLLDTQLTQINNAVKKITKWQKSVEPRSDLHSRRDCLELRNIVKEMDEFIRNDLVELPIAMSPETRAEFDTGFRGIAQEPAPPKAVPMKPPKPQLNNEDVEEF
ncbi:hypothetical protein BDP27DRAFT_1328979 [Rhodocollybia butyracea]|uniref:UvrD-like helicase ATP-binding domain-containing protein n=1 Tax=Rhodocollybia butyracea TaxID=206335 RepID=A0A9P5PQB3_9AGAR|nr:hypothetical protein BDP27DRAFT_1328979 [Rhodocollybia butyracea]